MSRPVLLLCLLACGGENPIVSDAGVPAPDNGDEVELAPYAGWPQEVAVRRVGDTLETTVSQLELDGRGGVWLLRVEWRAHRAPLAAAGLHDILVERFEPDGAFSAAQIFGGPGVDTPTGMTARGGAVLVTGSSRIVKHNLPNRTFERDLFVLRADLDDPARSSFRTLDLARDDHGAAMAEAPDGTILLGGRTDYVQVDTNSEVEDGKGLLIALSPDLARQTTLTLSGPRDVQVQALRLAPDGLLWFAGLRDGYLTHTEEAGRHNQGMLGATRLGL